VCRNRNLDRAATTTGNRPRTRPWFPPCVWTGTGSRSRMLFDVFATCLLGAPPQHLGLDVETKGVVGGAPDTADPGGRPGPSWKQEGHGKSHQVCVIKGGAGNRPPPQPRAGMMGLPRERGSQVLVGGIGLLSGAIPREGPMPPADGPPWLCRSVRGPLTRCQTERRFSTTGREASGGLTIARRASLPCQAPQRSASHRYRHGTPVR